jgi:uncharacterized membrane protein YccC
MRRIDMQIQRKRKTAAIYGAIVGLLATALALSWTSLADSHSPAGMVVSLRIGSYPFVILGAMVTYFLIVGDNWQPVDFYRYTLPINVVVNVTIGALLGWAWSAWREQRARARGR